MKRTLPAAILLASICLAAAPATWADPPPWAPAHGWRAKHRYTYYPRGEIYYAPESHLWFWLDGNDWRSGVRLPLEFQAYVRTGGVDIELGSDQPYVEQSYVIEHYGGEAPREYRGRDERHDRRDWRDDDRGDRGRRHGHGHDHDEGDDGG
jgi:hypothetical protein